MANGNNGTEEQLTKIRGGQFYKPQTEKSKVGESPDLTVQAALALQRSNPFIVSDFRGVGANQNITG